MTQKYQMGFAELFEEVAIIQMWNRWDKKCSFRINVGASGTGERHTNAFPLQAHQCGRLGSALVTSEIVQSDLSVSRKC